MMYLKEFVKRRVSEGDNSYISIFTEQGDRLYDGEISGLLVGNKLVNENWSVSECISPIDSSEDYLVIVI